MPKKLVNTILLVGRILIFRTCSHVVYYFSSFFYSGRMGNNKQALQLIIQEENDVEKVRLMKTCVTNS